MRDPETDRASAWLKLVKQITTHVAVERSFLYPVVKRQLVGSGRLADELRRDYKRMEHLLVLTERRKINSPDMPSLATELLDAFEVHQDRCTTLLVPAMKDQLEQDQLDELGVKMRGAENVILSHPHPHLLALGPVYRWTTRVAAIWDGVRDRMVRNR